MTCHQCGREGPVGRFCTWCGTSQAPQLRAPRRTFAAAPNEAVVSPAVLTTLFPHLADREVNEFRWAFAAGMVVLAGLYAAGLITAALIVAAILIPLLYTMYLYEARVYRDAPIAVTLGTLGGGFLVGVVTTLVLDTVTGAAARPGTEPGAVDLGGVVLAAILLPIVKEIVKPVPALLLRNRAGFGQSIDGLAFGIAAGLGYAAAETLVHFSAVITGLPAQSERGTWFIPLVSVGILLPLLYGSASGLITSALWQRGRAPRLAASAVAMAVGGHIAFVLGGQLIQLAQLVPVAALAWQALVVGALLVAVRVTLDRSLREEATELGLRESTCRNCGSEITAAGFCTTCGVALAATPNAAAGSAGAALPRGSAGDAR
jgi:RsiW-degrading membrane proteinase PrsW (M82 family)